MLSHKWNICITAPIPTKFQELCLKVETEVRKDWNEIVSLWQDLCGNSQQPWLPGADLSMQHSSLEELGLVSPHLTEDQSANGFQGRESQFSLLGVVPGKFTTL